MQMKYNSEWPLREKIRYVLSVLQKGSVAEIVMEMIELEGIAAEEEVADRTIATEQELKKMLEEGGVNEVKEHRQKKRYTLTENQD